MHHKKIAALMSAFMALVLVCGCSEKEYEKTVFAMDTVMTLRTWGEDEGLVSELEKRIKELENSFSVTDQNSDIYILNQQKEAYVSNDTLAVIKGGLELSEASEGALDLSVYPLVRAWGFTADEKRVPPKDEIERLLESCGYENIIIEGNKIRLEKGAEIDLGAVAKGYTADVLKAKIENEGIDRALLDLGGNICLIGEGPSGDKWGVGIRDPFNEGENIAVLRLRDSMVVTSGSYERSFEENGRLYHHILDPDTGMPSESGLVSVTVVGDNGLLCDGLSTALFVMGVEDGIELWRSRDDFDAVFITEDGRMYITEGLEGSFESQHSYEVCRK